ncbi:hypothetical protein SAMN05216349_11457 [Oribacterium sp. KHPX15]|uniref:hypothetical protein n=1 Tax=Oribacterium sp. KHPX15 TaxID=1855342 RepID=UPI00089BC39F|nr:hypothetical protein [Oribacterium sp. KHPX15]SEA49614.1 hypothetical protein SAMN05216349_11457 [Oribacterium sp. KHPX15]
MYKKTTKELEEILEHTHPKDIENFVKANEDDLLDGDRNFMKYMNERLKEKGLQKQDVLLRADISQGYGYKLLTEEKVTKQRDIILRICYAANFTLKETQNALKIYQMDILYARNPRDALLMTFFNEHPGSIIDINEMLSANKMMPLRSSGMHE